MTDTIPNVPLELLENLIDQHITAHGCTTETARQAQLMLSATSPDNHVEDVRAMVDAQSPAGVDGLEVVGYVSQDDIKWQGDCTLRLKPYSDYVIPLCRLSDAQAIIDGLRGENERIRLNIAEYNEAIACYQSERDQQAQRVGVLEAFMRCIQRMPVDDEFAERIIELIDSALASPATDAWISVSERLPGEDDQVLCWCEDETVAWAEVSSHHNSFFTDMTHELLPVTHWMPLPAAPIKIEANRHDQ